MAHGLLRRGGTYSYQRKVPRVLQKELKQKTIVVALGTGDKREAEIRARQEAVKADQLFAAARQKLAGHGGDWRLPRKSITDALLQRVAARALHDDEALALSRLADTSDERRDDLDHWLGMLLADGEAGGEDVNVRAALARRASKLIDEHKLPVADPVAKRGAEPVSQEYLSLIDGLRRAAIEHARREINRTLVQGEQNHDALFDGVTGRQAPAVAQPKALTLGEAMAKFEVDPVRARLSKAAAKTYVVPFRAMTEIIGLDKPVKEIDRADCVQVFEVMAALPAHSSKLPQYRGLKTLVDIVEKANELDAERISDKTIRNHGHQLSAFLNWCVSKGHVTANPATRLITGKARKRRPQRPYAIAELNAVIAMLPEWSKGSLGRRWAPIIALFSGMREGEVLMLTTHDFQVLEGADFMVLTETAERTLKNANAARRVPVHPELVRLGLLDLVQERRRHGGGRLFPELPGEGQTKIVDLFQKAYAYRLQRVLAPLNPAPGACFHGFRHGFRDALREAGVPTDAACAIGGWAAGGGVDAAYGQGLRPSSLARWMAQVCYRGVTLPILL